MKAIFKKLVRWFVVDHGDETPEDVAQRRTW